MAAVGIFVTTFGANEYWRLDTAKEPTFGAYGSEADWWELSGAEVKRVGDALEIRNVDNNASITPDEIARDLLGLPADAPITKKEATEAKKKLYSCGHNGFYNGFALVPIAFDPNDGHIFVDQPRLDAWNQTLLKRGFKFSK